MSFWGDMKKKLKERLEAYYASLRGEIPPPPEYYALKEKWSKITKSSKAGEKKKPSPKPGEKKKPSTTQIFIQLFTAFIIPMLIFFPLDLLRILLPLCITLIALIILLAIAAVKTGTDSVLRSTIEGVVLSLILVLFLIILTQFLNCGSQACFWVVSTRFGTLGAMLAFLIVWIIYVIIAVTTRGAKFFFITIILTIAIMFIMIPIMSPKNYYSFCKNIPFIYGTPLCKPREVRIDPLKTVKIPLSGGISVQIETPSTMYAGEPYEFIYTIKNLYSSSINFQVQPSMRSSYGSNVEFLQPYQTKKNVLDKNEFYQDSVYVDPEELQVGKGTCPYSTAQLGVAKGIYKVEDIEKEIECSAQKECERNKTVCVKLDIFECKCIDWIDATCSKNPLRAKLTVTHTGNFIGNSSLFYSEDIVPPAYGYELIQGPLSVIVEFQPNPYIAKIHQYRQDVSVYVRLKNLGGTIKIKNFKLEPLNTVIHTIDKEKGVEVIEEVGSEIISCKNIDEIIPNGVMDYGVEVGGKLCSIKPPFVKTTIKDLENYTIVEVNNVTYNSIKDFCEKKKVFGLENITNMPIENVSNISIYWSKAWDRIYETVGQTGLCEILNRKDEDKDKQIVEKALSHVDIILSFEYERKGDYYSGEIVPYTRTEECMKREEESKLT
jgi:hypothetical protein